MQVVDTTDRAAVGALITMPQYVDVIVPRGGKGLIARLMQEATVPMIKHLDGICHVYIDDKADIEKAVKEKAPIQAYVPFLAVVLATVLHLAVDALALALAYLVDDLESVRHPPSVTLILP